MSFRRTADELPELPKDATLLKAVELLRISRRRLESSIRHAEQSRMKIRSYDLSQFEAPGRASLLASRERMPVRTDPRPPDDCVATHAARTIFALRGWHYLRSADPGGNTRGDEPKTVVSLSQRMRQPGRAGLD